MKTILLSVVLLFSFTFTVFSQHEYAPLQKKKVNYQNWTYKDANTDKDVNLREFVKDKKLVMVVYFAPWCHSSVYQAPVTQKLYEKYKDKGFGVIGVSLYASKKRLERYLKEKKVTHPVVIGSASSKDREKTMHYKYRRKTGDKRKWGTPWNIFLETKKLKQKEDLLAKKAFVTNGEFIEKETEEFIRKKLGLSAED